MLPLGITVGTPSQKTYQCLRSYRPFLDYASDVALMQHPCDRYDVQDMDSKIFGSLVAALKRLVTEKPALLGAGSQMHGVG
jgi:hypothetical protein